MDDTTERLRTAREAYEARDWPRAYEAFAGADEHALGADDLAAYADACWWLGRNDDAMRLTEATYHAFLAESRAPEAARAAIDLAVSHFLRGDESQGSGWVGRAGRLARELPDDPVHGYLLYLTEVEASFVDGDPATVVGSAQRVQECGRRFDDPNLVAAGLHGEGRALLRAGRVADGMARIDEAMVTVLDGQVTPAFAGNLYCETMSACHEVTDLRRMARWTELAERWVRTMPAAVLFDGICRIHRTQLQVLGGEWDAAEREVREVAAELAGISVSVVAEAWYAVAEVCRLRGEHADAELAYGEAHARGRDPQPGRALLRLQEGDSAGALTSARSALAAAGEDPLARAPISAATVEIAVAAGRPDVAREAASELATTAVRYATSGLEAMAATARGAVLLADERPEEALPVLRDACHRWHDLDAEYLAATTCLPLATAYRALGDEPSALQELDRAEQVLGPLGARPALARVAALRGTPAPGGLTGREREVLALVAEGCSNRTIAERLYISDRTVARHLTNIFRKLGVESRTQAARYAFDHHLGPAPR